jgi:hypothetical protein
VTSRSCIPAACGGEGNAGCFSLEEIFVKVKCFECSECLDAVDAAAAVRAFVAHAKQRHSWSYPEEAVRNYARNYAEATERLSVDTQRLPEITEISVHAVTEDRIDDWLRFFDHDGFAGNPDWASCYASNRICRRRRNNPNARGATRARR